MSDAEVQSELSRISSLENLEQEQRENTQNSSFTNASQTSSLLSLSQIDNIYKGRSKKVPALHDLYDFLEYKGGRKLLKCRGCQAEIHTNEIKRQLDHLKSCKSTDKNLLQLAMAEYHNATTLTSGCHQNVLLTKMIIQNNCSYTLVESSTFKSYTKSLNRHYKPPSRKTISERYIPHLSKRAKRKFLRSKKEDYSLEAEFDGWKDGLNRSIMALIFTTVSGSRYLCGLKDVSVEGQSTDSYLKGIKELLKEIPPNTINSIKSDSASSCVNVRCEIAAISDYRHVIQHRCLAHFLNRIGWHISKKNTVVAEILDWGRKVAAKVNSSQRIQGVLRESGLNQVKRATDTRWYSNSTMITSLLQAKAVIIEQAPHLQDNTLIDLVVDRDKWVELSSLTEVFYPLAECIGQSERSTGSLGECVKSILEFGRSLMLRDLSRPVVRAALSSYLVYFSQAKFGDEFGLLILAYLLDRRYKLDYLTPEAIDLALATLLKIAKNSRGVSVVNQRVLATEFDSYCGLRGSYSAPSNEVAAVWWSKQDEGPLKQMALRIARLRSSSANIERTFSTMKYVQGNWRLRLSLDAITDLTRLRLLHHDAQEVNVSEEPTTPQECLNEDEDLDTSAVEEVCEIESAFIELDEDMPSPFDPKTRKCYQDLKNWFNFSTITSEPESTDLRRVSVEEDSIDDIVRRSRQNRDAQTTENYF